MRIIKAKYISPNTYLLENGQEVFLCLMGYLAPPKDKWCYMQLSDDNQSIVTQLLSCEE